jgi:hypothetical protein
MQRQFVSAVGTPPARREVGTNVRDRHLSGHAVLESVTSKSALMPERLPRLHLPEHVRPLRGFPRLPSRLGVTETFSVFAGKPCG